MVKKIHAHKAILVDSLCQKLNQYQSFLIYEYAGFTAKESTQLRADLFKASCQMVVYKNNILNRALKQSGIYLDAKFTGPNAIVLANEDIEPLKVIAKLKNTHKFIVLKAAYVDKNLMLADQLENFATLPTKKDLYAMFCQCLQSPLRKLMHVVKAVGETKFNN